MLLTKKLPKFWLARIALLRIMTIKSCFTQLLYLPAPCYCLSCSAENTPPPPAFFSFSRLGGRLKQNKKQKTFLRSCFSTSRSRTFHYAPPPTTGPYYAHILYTLFAITMYLSTPGENIVPRALTRRGCGRQVL